MRKQWLLSKATGSPLHPILSVVYNIPFTLAYMIRKQNQIDSFQELPREKQPPRSIWHNDYRINLWYDTLFTDTPAKGSELVLTMDEVQ